jgi:hypothetical protein
MVGRCGMNATALQIIQKAIEQSGESLLDDTGVDSKAARSLAERIVRELQRRRVLANSVRPPQHYLLVVAGDVKPDLRGPYNVPETRDEAAKAHRRDDPEMDDGLYPLDIDARGKPTVGSYCSSDFDDEEEEEAAVEKAGAA